MTHTSGERGAIPGLNPEMPFALAARAALRHRLKGVVNAVRELDPGQCPHGVAPEQIHRLRVSVRRASATLSALAPGMPPEAIEPLKRRLKRLRGAVGEVRGCDVNHAILSHEFHALHGPEREPLALLIAEVRRRRRSALRRLDRALAVHTPRRLKAARDRAIAPIEQHQPNGADAQHGAGSAAAAEPPGAEVTFARGARREILRLALALREAGAACGGAGRTPADDAESMHRLRLVGKRLRYASEIFSCCLSPQAGSEAQHLIVAMQDRLGAANDLFELARFVADIQSRGPRAPLVARGAPDVAHADLGPLRELFEARHARAAADFMAWHRAGGIERVARAFERLAGVEPQVPPAVAFHVGPASTALGSEHASGTTLHEPVMGARLAHAFPSPEELLGAPVFAFTGRQTNGNAQSCT